MTTPLDPRTLRWAARKMRKHERGMRACQEEAQSRKGRAWQKDAEYYMAKAHGYSNAASVLLLEARAIEKRRTKKAGKRG